MKAAVVKEFNRPLVIEDRPIPEPSDDQILVKIEAWGLFGEGAAMRS
jgi:propanol-preferring alcohol dehydrogenase